MSLPSATVGEQRGPGKRLAEPDAGLAPYLSCQISLLVAASRQRTTSSPPSREKTYSLSPTKAGVATPSPTATSHFLVSALGQVAGAVKPATLASRLGPRHCGQSAATAPQLPKMPTDTTSNHLALMLHLPGTADWTIGAPIMG